MKPVRVMCAAAVAAILLSLLTVPAATSATTTRVADGRIVISDFKTGEIYTVRPDGSHFRQLTHGAPSAFSFAPSWGPTGGHVVFVRRVNDRDRIYEMTADGARLHRVRTDPRRYNDEAPAYFPAGGRIVFSRCRADGSGCRIATMRRDGTGLHLLTPARHDVADFRPAVSPDGRFIAFGRFGADGIINRTFVMRSDGSHARPVTPARYEAYGPDWAPNGKRLLFSSNCCRLGGNVFTTNLASGAIHKITHTPWPLASLNGTYSPTGTRVALGSDRRHKDRCCVNMFIVAARGGPAKFVPLPINHVDQLDWAPRRP